MSMSFPLHAAVALAALTVPHVPASAEILLSQLILDLGNGKTHRGDIEVFNNGKERSYVVVEPFEVLDPGTPSERRVAERDPGKLGLLVVPARMMLEPNQHKLLRVATLGTPGSRERVYRITVKPTAGEVSADVSGLKILIGYEVLVMVRPAAQPARLVGRRQGRSLTIRNEGNSSVELADGKQCSTTSACTPLGGKRLYAGAEWTQTLPSEAAADYMILSSAVSARQRF